MASVEAFALMSQDERKSLQDFERHGVIPSKEQGARVLWDALEPYERSRRIREYQSTGHVTTMPRR